MKKVLLLVFALILSGCGSTTSESPDISIKPATLDHEIVMEETDAELANSIWDFTGLTHELLVSEENEVYSPLSLYLALSMLLPATSESTHVELLEGLSIASAEDFEEMVEPLLAKNNILDDEEDYASLLTNSVWLQDNRDDFDKEILDRLENRYQAMHQFADFKEVDETKELIESFIDEQTNGFIQDLDLTIDPDTVLLLLNTLYFKDQWLEEFSQDADFEFTTKAGEMKDVEGVATTLENPKYYEDEALEMVVVPFENGNQMLFIKPDNMDQFFEGEELSNVYSILEDLDYTNSTSVHFTMPEVDVNSSFDGLNTFLSSLGFAELMSDSPYLSYIEGDEAGMMINDIVQQARITVDREGVEAAAYTAIMVEETSAPIFQEEIEMILDQPYAMIVLSPEDIPMFVSTVVDPTSE